MHIVAPCLAAGRRPRRTLAWGGLRQHSRAVRGASYFWQPSALAALAGQAVPWTLGAGCTGTSLAQSSRAPRDHSPAGESFESDIQALPLAPGQTLNSLEPPMRGSHRERCNRICRCRRRSFRTAVIVVMPLPLGHDENRSRIVGCCCREPRSLCSRVQSQLEIEPQGCNRHAGACGFAGDDHRHAAPRAVIESGPLHQRHGETLLSVTEDDCVLPSSKPISASWGNTYLLATAAARTLGMQKSY